MDNKIFSELVNHGAITHVGLDKEKHDLDDLINLGVVTMPAADELYNKLVSESTESTESIESIDADDTDVTVNIDENITPQINIEEEPINNVE